MSATLPDGLHAVASPDALPPAGAVEALAPDAWAATRPDLYLVDVRGGATHARLSLWWTRPVPMPDAPDAPDAVAGAIGHAAWGDADAGAALLGAAVARLREAGCTHALGPMDGSTWHAYRVVTEAAPGGGTSEPPFAMEPFPPPPVAEAFARAGFAPVAHYLSSRVDRLPDAAEAVAARLGALAGEGVALAPAGDLEVALDAIYRVSLVAFPGNAFYTPLGRDAFLATYRPLLPHVDPRLVWLAHAGGAPLGFAFGVPDLAQAARGEAVDTVVVKTVAVVPEARALGLGGALVGALHEAARSAGYGRAIHALMHEANTSVRISTHTARPMRRYALLGRAV